MCVPAVEPLDLAALLLEGDDEYIDVVVSAEGVFVRVDDIFGEGVADVIEICAGVDLPAEEMVDAEQSALEGEVRLFLEVHLFLHLIPNKYNVPINRTNQTPKPNLRNKRTNPLFWSALGPQN